MVNEERQPFLFVGNHLALDFVNTQMIVRGKLTDLLESFEDLVLWLVQAKILTNPNGLSLREELAPGEMNSLFEEAKRLRGTLREIAERITSRKSIPDSAIAVINQVLSRRLGYPQLVRTKNGFERRVYLPSFRPDHLLVPIAEAAGDLLCVIDSALIKKCANAACILYFYDTTKNHRRHWCSMQLCGNRMKVAAFFRRRRKRK